MAANTNGGDCSGCRELPQPQMPLDEQKLDSLRLARAPDEERRPPRVLAWVIAAAGVAVASALVWLWSVGDEAPLVEVTAARSATNAADSTVLNATGYVVARRIATVSSKVTGRVVEVSVEEGMAVEAEQDLARLDDSTVRAQYELAASQLEASRKALDEVRVRLGEARRNLKRTRALREDNLVSETALDAAESEVAALQARLEALDGEVQVAERTLALRSQDLEDLVIRAPFAGVVISKDAQPGEMVSPVSAGGGFTRTGIATIVDMSSLEIEVDVNEAYINRVHAGQPTAAVLDAYPDWQIASRVVSIVPTADRQKATVRVRIGIDELDPRILPDMGVKVSFLAPTAEEPAATPAVALIPGSAVQQAGDATYVWVVSGEVAERRAVRLGERRGTAVEVLAGVRPGEKLVTGGAEGLQPGLRIRVEE